MNQNCHARSKQKRRKLRLKNMLKKIFRNRLAKQAEANKPKGHTIRLKDEQDKASNYAISITKLYPRGGGGWMFDNHHAKELNQRQKRKRARQAGRKVK